MLLQLAIQNLALIDQMEIQFLPGMNVLTGETGAGKSIVVDAVNLVLGERAGKHLIAEGQSKAVVEAVFDIEGNDAVKSILDQMELGTDEPIVSISRQITENGRNICRVNGTIVPLQTLKSVSSQLLDIHGQHEHQLLLDSRNHIQYLDGYGAERITPLREKVGTDYHAWHTAAQKLLRLRRSVAEREQRMDMLRFQYQELSEAGLREGEGEDLEKKKSFYRNAERIMSAFEEASVMIKEGGEENASACELLKKGIEALSPVSNIDEQYTEIYNRLNSLYFEIEDAASELTSLRDHIDFDQREAEFIEERLDLYHRLERKYGPGTDQLIAYRDKIKIELDELEGSDEETERLEKEIRVLASRLREASESLTEARKETALAFKTEIEDQLHELGMPNARLEAYFAGTDEKTKWSERFSESGVDHIEFLFSANLGQPLKPLTQVASGGELSRIMLAFKNLSARKPGIPRSMVFDEIDTGISGRMAQIVAEKMCEIGDHHQVICVSHLPQIAAMADEQYLVQKYEEDGKTHTRVIHLDSEGRVQEIARMVGGASGSDSSLRHADMMIHEAMTRKGELRMAMDRSLR